MRTTGAILLAILATAMFAGLVFRYVPLHDWVEYWSAAHVFVKGQNPYSIEQMMEGQQALGWKEKQPLVVMSPPHFLPLLLPLGFMHSYTLGRMIWLYLSMGLLVLEDLFSGVFTVELPIRNGLHCVWLRCFSPFGTVLRLLKSHHFCSLGLSAFSGLRNVHNTSRQVQLLR